MKLCTRISLCSSQLLQVVLVGSFYFQTVQLSSPGNETDRVALLHFKESVTTDPIGFLSSWNDSVPHCNWSGVICNKRRRRVASLILEGRKLSGPISSHIGNLSFLRHLNLRNNSFHGAVPQQVGKLFRLQYLSLDYNRLDGEIPVNLTSCSNLEKLILQENNLNGNIPAQLGSLVKLRTLKLVANSLTGIIPSSLGNLTSLHLFSASFNKLVGGIPGEMKELKNLTVFLVGSNNLSGVIPPFLFNISSIEILAFTDNNFYGGIPDKGFNLPKLIIADFGMNQLSGKIPSSLSNSSYLQSFDIKENNFVGPVPSNIGDLSDLSWLNLGRNNLGRNSTSDLDFLASLASCRNLEIIDITQSNFGGFFPQSIANFSTQLSELYAGSNQIFGMIPPSLDNLTNLIALGLENNLFTGEIPSNIGKLQKLQVLALGINMLSGRIPFSIGNLSQLSLLDFPGNNIEGSIPSSIGKCQNLNYLGVDMNNLTGQIPEAILTIPSLSVYLGLSSNHFSGGLSQTIGKLTTINEFDISYNLLSGEIPSTIGSCVSLEELHMQGNSFQGMIPEAMASLKGLRVLDLSRNNLTGNIPRLLESLNYLQYLNISFNNLEGEVPIGGVFANASAIFLAGNSRLCGGIPELHLPKCPAERLKKGKVTKFKLAIIIGCLLLFAGLVVVLLLLFWKKKLNPKQPTSTFGPEPHITISYKSLHEATNGFSSQNLLGYGSFGSVYKGLLDQVERPVAVKVLNLQRQGASRSITAECNALRNIRHRNLVKLITYCSSLDYKGDEFKALVFEFMPNGSLENWLHSESNHPRGLDIQQRLSIAIDVCSALQYLHDLCEVPIIHRDLKPSNVLLDDEMVAHVGDFGLAKFLSTSQSSLQSQTSTLGIQGTTGYVAPEYGLGAIASKEGDIYSYGILLLEMFSGRRPTDDIFTGGLNLVDFIKKALPGRAMQVADPVLFQRDVDETEAASSSTPPAREYELSCLIFVLKIGVSCSEESPSQRANLRDVLRKLHKIKDTFLNAQLSEGRPRTTYAMTVSSQVA